MSWIRSIPEDEASGRLAELYERSRDPHSGAVDNVLAIHGLNPRGLEAHLAVYRSSMHGTPGLPKVDRELVAVVVSRANDCHY